MTAQQRYETELKTFRGRMKAKRPRREDYGTDEEYARAIGEWSMALSCDAPNRPGYHIANND